MQQEERVGCKSTLKFEGFSGSVQGLVKGYCVPAGWDQSDRDAYTRRHDKSGDGLL